jgi:proliferating cell nuclear antigen PCNA
MSRIVDIKTEHSYEIKTLFDVLKEILNEVKIDFIRDPIDTTASAKKVEKESSEDEESSEDDSSEDDSDAKAKDKKKPVAKKTIVKKDGVDDEKEKEQKKSSVGGIRILALDEHQTLLIYVKLNSDKFSTFEVKPACHSIGLDLIQFHKFMKTVDKDCIMSIYIDKYDEQNIVFELQNSVKHNNATYKQKLLDIDENDKKLPQETNFEMSVIMDTTEFKKTCTEMNQFSEYAEITCTSKEIIFKCQGDSNAYSKTFKNSDTGVKIISFKNGGKTPTIVQAIYNLKHLVTFGKCTNLCSDMQLYLKNDYPLFIHYTIGLLGKMLVGLSPVDEKNIKRDNDYDENMDKYYNNKKAVMKEM